MSYAFDKDAEDGKTVTLENGATYQFDAAKDRWLVKAVAGGGDFDGELYATKEDIAELEKQDKVLELYAGSVDKTSKARDEDLQEQIDGLAAGDVDLSPVEERLDEIEDVLPKAPAVIEPVEIGVTKTLIDADDRPSGTGKPPMENLLMWHMDAGKEASGNIPGNEMKTQIPNENIKNILIDGTKEVWFRQGDRVQKWNVTNGGWFTGTNLWHLSAASTEGDDLVADQPVEVYYIDPFKESDDLIDAISRIESKADDRRLQAEIEQLALGLETLLLQREAGKWSYKGALADGAPSQPGQFSLASDDLSSSENIIILNQTDGEGKFHGFGDVEVGDYVEIVDLDKPDEYALFVVDSEPDGNGIVSINLKLKDKGNNFLVGTTCEIRFFAINEQNLDITELDQRYLKLTGGEMTGSLGFSGSNLSIDYRDGNGQNFIQFKFGTTTEYRGFNSSEYAIANKKTVQEQIDAALAGSSSGAPFSAKSLVGFQLWSETRLAEGCFNLLDENQSPTSNCRNARAVSFATIQGQEICKWMSYALTGKGQIHLMDMDGKYLMSRFVKSAEKHDAASGSDPVGAIWFFELEEQYGFDADTALSGNYFIEFDHCLEAD